MADYPPYMNAYGNIERILNKIKDAPAPDRFTHDYLETVLGFSGGSARPFVSFAKRIGLLGSDGTPTDLYHQFRNASSSEQAIAIAIRHGYDDLFKRNEFAYALDSGGLKGLVLEITGLEKASTTATAIVKSFETLAAFANFELSEAPDIHLLATQEVSESTSAALGPSDPASAGPLHLSHSIHLHLPDTTDAAVFNAIFKALREHLVD